MDLIGPLLVASVLATAEFCAHPVEGGVGEPQFCRLEARQEIATPYFSIVVEADFHVGVDREGRRLLVQSTVFKNLDHLSIEVLDGSSLPDWPDCEQATETQEEHVKWADCRISSDGMHERRLAAGLKDRHVLIQYAYSPLGTVLAPALERMTQSIRVVAN